MEENVGIILLVIVIFVTLALNILIWCLIFKKAGYGAAFGLLMLIPLVNLVMLLILAFGKWPVLRELEQLRQQISYRTVPGGHAIYPGVTQHVTTTQPSQTHRSTAFEPQQSASSLQASMGTVAQTQAQISSPTCPSCGTKARADARFCPNCGSRLDQAGR